MGSFSAYNNPKICALAVYHDDLIVGGYFDGVDEIEAKYIARWTGSDWRPWAPALIMS